MQIKVYGNFHKLISIYSKNQFQIGLSLIFILLILIKKHFAIHFFEDYMLNKEVTQSISKHIGIVLKHERMRQNISIATIAKAVNVNASTIVSVEDAKHQASFVLIYSMIKYLKINLNEFFVSVDTHYPSL